LVGWFPWHTAKYLEGGRRPTIRDAPGEGRRGEPDLKRPGPDCELGKAEGECQKKSRHRFEYRHFFSL